MPSMVHPAASSASSGDLAVELRAILTAAAFAPVKDRAWLRITGSDATRWLNGMATNAINALGPGEGCYNFLLNAQGRILGDCMIYRDPSPEPAAFLLETDASQLETVQTHLDRFIIMDDVELADTSQPQSGIVVVGPFALKTVAQLGGTECTKPDSSPAPPSGITLKQTSYTGSPVSLIRAHDALVPRFEIWADSKTIADITAELAAVPHVSTPTLEALRILSGIPKYGVDIRNTDQAHDLPQETAQDARALHFAKGCYLGQEIVERIRSRGSVHRTFTGFMLHGDLPPAGAELTTESQPRPVGELTSVAAVPRAAVDPSAGAEAVPLQIALGYIRREALDRNFPLSYPGGAAIPTALPFSLPQFAAATS